MGVAVDKPIALELRHKAGYWKDVQPRIEAVAHMFEARMMKGERLDVIRTFFPNAYRQFEDTIRRLERSGLRGRMTRRGDVRCWNCGAKSLTPWTKRD